MFMDMHISLDAAALQPKVLTTRRKYLTDAYQLQRHYLKELTTMNRSVISWNCFLSC